MSDKINKKDFFLKEKNEEDFKLSIIERRNVSTEFTLAVLENHENDLQKMEKELASQVSVCEKTVDNILRNHKWLTDLDAEKLHHAWMLKENLDVVERAKPKLEEVKSQLKQYAELKDVVYAKFGFVETGVPTDINDIDNESGQKS